MRTLMKWIVRGIGLIIIIFIALGVFSFFSQPGEPPTVAKAPWYIQTYSNDEFHIPSRLHLAENVEFLDDQTPVITRYWSFDGANYKFNRGQLAFPVDVYGKIDINQRQGGE